MKGEKQLNTLALITHTSFAVLASLIAIYNGQRGNKWRCAIYTGIVVIEVPAILDHISPEKEE